MPTLTDADRSRIRQLVESEAELSLDPSARRDARRYLAYLLEDEKDVEALTPDSDLDEE